MGTNYYVTYNQCAHCGRGTELHVGKSGTVVRAHPDLGIRSWADWVRLLGAVDHTCRDEYGDELTDDMLREVFERTPLAERRRDYDWVQQNAASGADTWLDDDGYSVTSAEFC